MLPLLSHVLKKHGEAWEYFSGHINRAWISMETMGLHLLVILNGMENHGKQGTAFLMISNSMEKHGGAWKPFFMSSDRILRKACPWEAWDPCATVFA